MNPGYIPAHAQTSFLKSDLRLVHAQKTPQDHQDASGEKDFTLFSRSSCERSILSLDNKITPNILAYEMKIHRPLKQNA